MLPLVMSTPLAASYAALSVGGAKCGTKICEIYQFCSKFHTGCEDCSLICDADGHNFEEETCLKDCQNYLHDSRFVKISDYSAQIKQLKNQQTVIFIVILVLLILFIVTNGARFYRWCNNRGYSLNCAKIISKKNKEKTIEPVTHMNPHTESPKMATKKPNNNYNRTSSVFSGTVVTENDQKTVSTPVSTRHPAEDTLTSTGDFSYDNRGMQLTPSGDKPKGTETTF